MEYAEGKPLRRLKPLPVIHPVIENQLPDSAGFIHAAHIIGVGEWYQFGGKWVIVGIDEPKRYCKRNVVPIGFELLILERNFAISLFEAFILISSTLSRQKDCPLIYSQYPCDKCKMLYSIG